MSCSTRRIIFSRCRKYRYTLRREWICTTPSYCQFIGLNPSTADEVQDDPTVRRCIHFAKRWGFGALCMTSPGATPTGTNEAQPNPIAEIERHTILCHANDSWRAEIAKNAGLVVAAWGKHGRHLQRDHHILNVLSNLHCLGTNKDGTQKHPLYLLLQPNQCSKRFKLPRAGYIV